MKKLIIGGLLGVLALGLVRFAAAPWEAPTHYHANWALFIEGERQDLSADRYMEEVEACVAEGRVQPSQRVHMHNNEDHVVHVHHEGVTWGHFLGNLGFGVGEDYLITDDGRRLFEEEGRALTFVVNGFPVGEIHDRLIDPGDRLVISYGSETAEEVLEEQFPRVESDAPRYDEEQDPAGCAGVQEETLGERLLRAFWG